MDRQISITAGTITVTAILNDSATATALWNVLPISATIQTWGDEIYFATPVQTGLEDSAVETVAVGDIAYWPPGNALCLFWGPTPASAPGEIRPASAVNVIGAMQGAANVLNRAATGTEIVVSKFGE